MSDTATSQRVPKLGVLQLKTTFPRPPGDVGNAASWGDIPVVIRVVEEADSKTVVGGTWGTELVDAFVREGERLIEEEGCVAFVTSCGFVSAVQRSVTARKRLIVARDDAPVPRRPAAVDRNEQPHTSRVAAEQLLPGRKARVRRRRDIQKVVPGQCDAKQETHRLMADQEAL